MGSDLFRRHRGPAGQLVNGDWLLTSDGAFVEVDHVDGLPDSMFNDGSTDVIEVISKRGLTYIRRSTDTVTFLRPTESA